MRLVRPRGQPYFVSNSDSDFAIVTEVDMDDIQTEGRILACLKEVKKELQYHNISVPPRCELFLELEGDHLSCNYYFVDHDGKGLFWLEEMSPEILEIPTEISPSYLGMFYLRRYLSCLILR